MEFSSTAPAPRFGMFARNGQLLAVLVLVCTLIGNFLFTSGYDEQRCVELAALGLMTLILVVRAAQGRALVIPPATALLLLGFFALGLVSALTAQSLHHALYEWSIFLLLLVLVFAVAGELSANASAMPGLLYCIGLACGLYALRVTIMYAAALATGFQMDMYTLAVGFSNPRALNHAQTPLLPLIVLLCLQAPRGSVWRRVWFVLAAFWWSLLFVCEARASILGLTAGCAAALALRRGQARSFLAMMAWTALAGLVLYGLLFILLPQVVGMPPLGAPANVITRTVANPSSNRNVLWTRALELISAHPWLGVGPQHFAHAGADLQTGAHPHDWLLQIGVEWGVPALLCLLGVVVLGARALVRTGARLPAADTVNQQILAALLVACAAMFVDGLFSGVLVMPQSQLAIALVLGMTCGWVRLQQGADPQTALAASLPARAIAAGLAGAGLCCLLWAVAPGLVQHARDDALTPAELAHNPGTFWPRMWQAGYF